MVFEIHKCLPTIGIYLLLMQGFMGMHGDAWNDTPLVSPGRTLGVFFLQTSGLYVIRCVVRQTIL